MHSLTVPPALPALPELSALVAAAPLDVRTPLSDILWYYQRDDWLMEHLSQQGPVAQILEVYVGSGLVVALFKARWAGPWPARSEFKVGGGALCVASTDGSVAATIADSSAGVSSCLMGDKFVVANRPHYDTVVKIVSHTGITLREMKWGGYFNVYLGPPGTLWESHFGALCSKSVRLYDAELVEKMAVRTGDAWGYHSHKICFTVADGAATAASAATAKLLVLQDRSVAAYSRDGSVSLRQFGSDIILCGLLTATDDWCLMHASTRAADSAPGGSQLSRQAQLVLQRRSDGWRSQRVALWRDQEPVWFCGGHAVTAQYLGCGWVFAKFVDQQRDGQWTAGLIRVSDIGAEGRAELINPVHMVTLRRRNYHAPTAAAYAAREVATVAAAVAAVDDIVAVDEIDCDCVGLVRAVLVGFLAEDARLTVNAHWRATSF